MAPVLAFLSFSRLACFSVDCDNFHDSSDGMAGIRSGPSAIYRPLDKDTQEIRLLWLHAGADETPIALSLESAHLHNAGYFTAFSYCWGAPDNEAEVIVNCHAIRVRRNLWHFLKSFRAVQGSARIWIDSICINQSDKNERKHQITLMQEIFSAAASVYAWLGEKDTSTDDAINYIEQASLVLPKERSKQIPPDVRTRGIKGLKQLVKREYWSRVWIIQEVLLSKTLRLMIGNKMIKWEDLEDIVSNQMTMRRREHAGTRTTKTRASRQNFYQIWLRKRDRSASTHSPDLYALLEDFHYSRCHDPRDRIYGMLGLVSKSLRSAVIIDYDLSLVDVCKANAEIICGSGHHSSESFTKYARIFEMMGMVFADKKEFLALWRNDPPITQPLVIETKPLHGTPLCFPLGAFRHGSSNFEPLPPKGAPVSFEMYVTRVALGSEGSEFDNTLILYSTTHCKNWDLLLMLDHQVFLVAQEISNCFVVVDITLDAGTGSIDATKDAIYLCDPRKWLALKDPSAQCLIKDIPLLKKPTSTLVSSWKVQLNGAAFTEAMRLKALHDTDWKFKVNFTLLNANTEKYSLPKDSAYRLGLSRHPKDAA